MLFTVAKPLEREEFLQLYRQVSLLTKLLFAPFGLHCQIPDLLGKNSFVDTYSPIYQQLEDVLSKCIFRAYGYDDDQIVATMHKFVGQSQDRQVIQEIKPANEALVLLVTEMEVVEYSSSSSRAALELFENEELYSLWLEKLIVELQAFYHQLQESQMKDSTNDPSPVPSHGQTVQVKNKKKNFDKDIFDRYQMTIGIHTTNPILEMHQFCLEYSKESIYEIIQRLLSIFKSPSSSSTSSSSIEAPSSPVTELSYYQLAALHEVYSSSSSSAFSEVVRRLLQKHDAPESSSLKVERGDGEQESVLFISSHRKNEYHIDQFRSGELFPVLTRFLDPSMSFILQMSDWLSYQDRLETERQRRNEFDSDDIAPVSVEEDKDDDLEVLQRRKQLVSNGQKSLAFVLLALERLQLAKEYTASGAAETALEQLNNDLLEVLEKDKDSGEEVRLVIPAHTRVLLLLERAKLYLELSEVVSSLEDIETLLSYDDGCAAAYALRSQILLATLQIQDPLFVASITAASHHRNEESTDCLSQLLPNTSGTTLLLDQQDIRLHEAAEDALFAFLLGGSNDLGLASAAEEAARETCRKFAKAAYAEKLIAAKAELKTNTAVPRNWLLQSYFSGWDPLSQSLGLYGESTLPLYSAAAGVSVEEEIDESTPEERLKLLAPSPPDYLVDGGVVTEADRGAYSLLCQLTNQIESTIFAPSSSSTHLTPETEELMKKTGVEVLGEEFGGTDVKVFDQIAVFDASASLGKEDSFVRFVASSQDTEEELLIPYFLEESKWILADFGRILPYELSEKTKIVPLNPSTEGANENTKHSGEGLSSEEFAAVLQDQKTVSQLTALFRDIFSLLSNASHFTGVEFTTEGKIHQLTIPYTPYEYPADLEASSKRKLQEKKNDDRAADEKEKKSKKNSKGKEKFNAFCQIYGIDPNSDEMPEEMKAMFERFADDVNLADRYGEENDNEDDEDSSQWEDFDGDEGEEDEEEDGIPSNFRNGTHHPNSKRLKKWIEKEEMFSRKEGDQRHHHHHQDEEEEVGKPPQINLKEDEEEEEEEESEVDVEFDTDYEEEEEENGKAKSEQNIEHLKQITENYSKISLDPPIIAAIASSLNNLAKEEQEEEEEDDEMDGEVRFAQKREYESDRYIGSTSSQFGTNTSNNSVISSTMMMPEEAGEEDEEEGGVDGISQLNLKTQESIISSVAESLAEDANLPLLPPTTTSAIDDAQTATQTHLLRHKDSISTKLRARLLNICGSIAYLSGDALGAVQCFEASVFYDADLLDSQVKLASLLIDLDEVNQAAHLLSQAQLQFNKINVGKDDDDPVILLHFGELEINRGDFKKATEYLRKANYLMNDRRMSADEASSASAWFGRSQTATSPASETPFWDNYARNRSTVYYPPSFLGASPAEAEKQYQHYYEISQQFIHGNIIALLGVSSFRTDPTHPEYAMVTMEQGLKQYPQSSILLLCAGEIHSQCGDMTKSIKLFHKAHLLDPYNPLPLINASRTYQQLGELHTAKTHIETAMKCDPNLAMTHVDYAQLLRQLDKIGEAVQMIDDAYRVARHVSEIKDVLVAKYVTQLQQMIKDKGILVI